MALQKYYCPIYHETTYSEIEDERLKVDCEYCLRSSAYYVGEESFEDDE